MIDLNFLRKNPDITIRLLKKKDPSFDASLLLDLDQKVRNLNKEIEEIRHKKNEVASKARTGLTEEMRELSIELGKILKEKETDLNQVKEEFDKLYLNCPNLPAEDLPEGGKESNLVVKTFGDKPTFDFEIKNHIELGKSLGWFDFEAASKVARSRFVLYKDSGVNLIYSLTMLMLNNNTKFGFSPILPPYLVNEKSLEVASNFPKFKDQVYSVPEDNLFLIPTSEVSLTNVYRNHIFNLAELPKRMTSWTSCFRREAGTYGAAEHGLIRIHQFEKVELYTICDPKNSDAEQELMLKCAESILQQLGLHYRVSLLASQDCSFPSAKTYDIEVWMPAQKAYYEVSSISNCTDFQSRRGLIRYKKDADDKTQLVHTLNGSSLAIPRLMVALIETYQQKDGSIKLPEILKNFGY